MLRVIHAYNIKPGVDEKSFVEWLDSRLDEVTRRFGCIGRQTWIYLDGFDGPYERPHAIRHPKFLNEAFWVGEEAANKFRTWLLSEEGADLRRRGFESITDHTVGSGRRGASGDPRDAERRLQVPHNLQLHGGLPARN